MDRELLHRAMQRDPAAVTELNSFLTGLVNQEVRTLVFAPAAPALTDLSQEVLWHLMEDGYRRLRGWDPERGLGYVITCIHHRVSSILRSRKDNPWRERPTAPDDLGTLQGAELASQEVAVREGELLASLLRILNERFKEEDRALLRAVVFEDRPVEELARRFGKTPAALCQWKSRLLKKLRPLVAQIIEKG